MSLLCGLASTDELSWALPDDKKAKRAAETDEDDNVVYAYVSTSDVAPYASTDRSRWALPDGSK